MLTLGALPLAPTANELHADPRAAVALVAKGGFRHIQLSAAAPGIRPRELDRSGRRDLLALLKRHELTLSGMDLWIALEHFHDPAKVDRAMAAVCSAIELCADCGRVPLSMLLPAPREAASAAIAPLHATVAQHAERFGVEVADHALPVNPWNKEASSWLRIGIDPASALLAKLDPVSLVSTCGPGISSARLSDVSAFGQRVVPDVQRTGGTLDVMAYKVALAVSGYARPVVLDARGWPEKAHGLARAQQAWARQ